LAPEAFPPPAFFGELTMRWEAAGWLPMASADARCPLVSGFQGFDAAQKVVEIAVRHRSLRIRIALSFWISRQAAKPQRETTNNTNDTNQKNFSIRAIRAIRGFSSSLRLGGLA
jgi:hypothetical protein